MVLFPIFFFASESRTGPNSLLVPVYKDNQTSLHVINIQKRTPLKTIPFLVDLNGKFLSVNCDQDYLSSTYNPPFCHSTLCARTGPHFCHKCSSSAPKPGCHNNTCAVITTNPLTKRNVAAEIAQDVLAIQSTNLQGSNPGQLVIVRRFLFACTPSFFLQGPLPKNVQGIAGFGHNPVSLPIQLASHFGFPPKFAFCLPSINNQNGVIFFGNTSYRIHPGIDFSVNMKFTPLSVGSQGEYFILVKSIRISDREIPLNASLISRTRSFGGTMISTINPYTVLEHSIYQTFSQFFTNEMTRMGASQVDTISPFGVCFRNVQELPKVGIGAPLIDFVMQNRNVSWRIYGPNSLIQARPGIWCFAFVDGGSRPRASIVLGAHQLENTIVEFDLARSRLGFSAPLHLSRVSCGQFNFTSSPP